MGLPVSRLRVPLGFAGLVLAVSLLLATPSAVGQREDEPGLSGVLETPGDLLLRGEVSEIGDHGVVHYHGQALPDMHLQADQVVMNVTWEEGEIIEYPTGGSHKTITGQGAYDVAQENVSLSLEGLQPRPQILAFVGEQNGSVAFQSTESTRAATLPEGLITEVGWEAEVETRDYARPYFRHDVETDSIELSDVDNVRTEGTFTLFVHNVTLVGKADEGSINHWTGFRSNQTAPGVREFHHRVTVLRVEAGSLQLEQPGGLEVLTEESSPSLDGTVSTMDQPTIGRLANGEVAYVYNQTPAILHGDGTIALTPTSDPSCECWSTSQAPLLEVGLAGGFQASPTPGVEVQELQSSQAEGMFSLLWGWWTFVALALPLVGVGGAVLFRRRKGRAPDRDDEPGAATMNGSGEPSPQDPVPSNGRGDRVFEQRLDRAIRLYREQDFRRAQDILEELTVAQPEHPSPWFYLGQILLEHEQFSDAEEAFSRFLATIGEREPDALLGLVRARVGMGDREGAVEALVELSSISPRQAAFISAREPTYPIAIAAIEELSVEAIEGWARQMLRAGRRGRARRIAEELADRRPSIFPELAETEAGAKVAHFVVDRLPATLLRGLVEVAWSYDHLDVASDAFVQLVAENRQMAQALVEEPKYAPLANDARIEGLDSHESATDIGGR